MFHSLPYREDLSCGAKLDDHGNIILVVAVCRCVIEQVSAADCVSVVKKIVHDIKHLFALFDEEFVKGVAKNEIRERCRAEFNRAYETELTMLLEDAKELFGGKGDGAERQVLIKTDSDEYWQVVLYRANLSLDDLIAAIKENDHETALSGRLMWGQLKAGGPEPNWWVKLGL